MTEQMEITDLPNYHPAGESQEIISESNPIIETNEEQEETFERQDTTEVQKESETDLSKYTTVDNLDEDKPIRDQKYVLISYLSPSTLKNCNLYGVKVRGVCATEQEAKKKVEQLRKQDKYFDIYVAPVGKWVPLDPDISQAESVKYGNKELNAIMENTDEKHNELMLSNLNEMAGIHKERVDQGKASHTERVNNMKEMASKQNANVSDTSSRTDLIRERMRRKMEQRQLKLGLTKESGNASDSSSSISQSEKIDKLRELSERMNALNSGNLSETSNPPSE